MQKLEKGHNSATSPTEKKTGPYNVEFDDLSLTVLDHMRSVMDRGMMTVTKKNLSPNYKAVDINSEASLN